jgi:hypothetical protein
MVVDIILLDASVGYNARELNNITSTQVMKAYILFKINKNVSNYYSN